MIQIEYRFLSVLSGSCVFRLFSRLNQKINFIEICHHNIRAAANSQRPKNMLDITFYPKKVRTHSEFMVFRSDSDVFWLCFTCIYSMCVLAARWWCDRSHICVETHRSVSNDLRQIYAGTQCAFEAASQLPNPGSSEQNRRTSDRACRSRSAILLPTPHTGCWFSAETKTRRRHVINLVKQRKNYGHFINGQKERALRDWIHFKLVTIMIENKCGIHFDHVFVIFSLVYKMFANAMKVWISSENK